MGTTAPLRAGDMVAGKYRLEHEIGSGGMGVVFAAQHVQLDQRVALKFLFVEAAQNAEIVERFKREARAAVKIQSEHVARVMDIGVLAESGTPYIVMEYLEGDDLENVVKASGPLPIHDAVRYLLQACEALAEVHALGVVHRDIKPANLFLAARADGSSIVKLLDFGISKAAPAWTDANDSLTNTAAVIGSPRYMSPEQLRSSRDVDMRSDVWALGVTLFELLGGTSPFARGTMPEVCASILKDEPLSLAGLRPGIPAELEGVIRRCLSKSADGRYRNVAELAMALRPFGQHGIIDISIERIVGIIQMSMMPADPPTTRIAGGTARSAALKKTSDKSTERRTRSSAEGDAQSIDKSTERRTRSSAERDAQSIDKSTERPTRSIAEGAAQSIDKTATRTPEELEKHYLSRIGPRRQSPHVAMSTSQITSLSLDHRAGFLLSLVDGRCTIEELLDISGMPRVETLRVVCELLDQGVLALTPRPR
ncbi:MAG: serine/threonine-protein kinase [Kofleriaceae bacterium]